MSAMGLTCSGEAFGAQASALLTAKDGAVAHERAVGRREGVRSALPGVARRLIAGEHDRHPERSDGQRERAAPYLRAERHAPVRGTLILQAEVVEAMGSVEDARGAAKRVRLVAVALIQTGVLDAPAVLRNATRTRGRLDRDRPVREVVDAER